MTAAAYKAIYAVMTGKLIGNNALGQEYADAVRDHRAEREARKWVEWEAGDTLDDEDFSDWPHYPAR